jgi:LysR family nitrogen assimilation transcriptional regulator
LVKELVSGVAAGHVSIGIPTSWQNVFTIPLIEEMLARFPGVTLRVYEGLSHVIRDDMFSGLLDLCIIPLSVTLVSGYPQTALAREPLVLIGDGKAGLTRDHPTPLSALDGVKLVLPGRPNVLRSLVEQSLSRKGLHFRLTVETDTVALCIDLARKGVGYTVVPACAVFSGDMQAGITWSPLKGTAMSWALCENSSRTHSQMVREARKLVFEVVSRSLGTGEWLGAESSATPRSATPRSARPDL